MKALMILLILTAGSFAKAEWHELPVTIIDQRALGGTVLLLQMKYSLVVSGSDEAQIINELGLEGKKELFKNMIQNKSAEELKTRYGNSNHNVTNSTIARYEALVGNSKALTLN
jgi:hypothetical protein